MIQPLTIESNARTERAKQILAKGNPETIDENTYLVPSQTSDKKYKVTHLDSYSCECVDFTQRCVGTGMYCKHIKAIILFHNLKKSYEVQDTLKAEIENILAPQQSESCPSCQSQNIIKRGTRTTATEVKQRFACKDCKHRFVLTPITNIKGNAKFVCLAMDCYYKGLSYRDISDQFRQFYGLELHHETIRRWVLQFGNIMEERKHGN